MIIQEIKMEGLIVHSLENSSVRVNDVFNFTQISNKINPDLELKNALVKDQNSFLTSLKPLKIKQYTEQDCTDIKNDFLCRQIRSFPIKEISMDLKNVKLIQEIVNLYKSSLERQKYLLEFMQDITVPKLIELQKDRLSLSILMKEVRSLEEFTNFYSSYILDYTRYLSLSKES